MRDLRLLLLAYKQNEGVALMKTLFASALLLLTNVAFAATITPVTRTEPVPSLNDPAVFLMAAVMIGFGLRYLRTRKQS